MIYTIVAETDLTDITGIRLEVLPDDGLPNKGPGRAPDGNFVLTEIEVPAAPKADSEAGQARQACRTRWPTSARRGSGSPRPSTATLTTGHRLGRLADHGRRTTGPPSRPRSRSARPAAPCSPSSCTTGSAATFTSSAGSGCRSPGSPGRGLGLPEEFRAVLATVPELRTEAQKNLLFTYFRAMDADCGRRSTP